MIFAEVKAGVMDERISLHSWSRALLTILRIILLLNVNFYYTEKSSYASRKSLTISFRKTQTYSMIDKVIEILNEDAFNNIGIGDP